MNEILFMIGDWPVHTGAALIGFAALALALLLIIAIVIARSGRRGAELAVAQAIRADELEERLSEMLRAQSEATGRVDAMGQALRATPWIACGCCTSGSASSTTPTRTSPT